MVGIGVFNAALLAVLGKLSGRVIALWQWPWQPGYRSDEPALLLLEVVLITIATTSLIEAWRIHVWISAIGRR